MALMTSAKEEMGTPAKDFSLVGVDGKTISLDTFKEKKALLVIFMCNHCPYVIAVQDRINQIAKDYADQGVAVVGINSNDAENYPEDSYEKMKQRAKEKNYAFSYLYDETQEVAKAYGAVCTPDPYLYENQDGKFLLRYHGRIDDSWKDESAVTSKDLRKAIEAVLKDDKIEFEQKPSMGCSIKWK